MNYKEIVENVVKNGSPKEATRLDSNGNVIPVENGTIGTFAEIFRHDMSKGFPLSTLRRLPWKSIRVELEGFLKAVTDKSWYKDRQCNFWSEWSNPLEVEKEFESRCSMGWITDYSDPKIVPEAKKHLQEELTDLGPIYGHQFRCFGDYSYELKSVEKRYSHSRYPSWIPNYKITTERFVEIIEDAGKDDNRRPLVKVRCKSGFEKTVRKDHFTNGVSDPYQITVYGVGYLGEVDDIDKSTALYKNLYKTWSHMLERCYIASCKEYKYYGQKGVYVCDKWMCFANFYNDCQKIDGFAYKLRSLKEYVLDKDHYSSNVYSPDTCVWLPKEMNIVYSSIIFFEAISPDGQKHYHISPSKFADQYNLNAKQIRRCLNGERKSHKKWKFEITEDRGLRFSLPIDQLKSIVDKLKSNPYDRRMVCSAWNPNQMHMMALPPCHFALNVVVYGNKLNLIWHQRSCDLMLGVPANIASYALLLLLLCEESGLQPGELVGTLADCHIYNNLMPATQELLQRDERPLPEVKIKRKADGSFSIFDWTYEDVELIGYNPHPKLNMGTVTV